MFSAFSCRYIVRGALGDLVDARPAVVDEAERAARRPRDVVVAAGGELVDDVVDGETGLVHRAMFASHGAAPLLADGVRARLPDVDPMGDVHLDEVELEERMMADGLDHSADTASRHDLPDKMPGRRRSDTSRAVCTDAELVVLRAGKGVDHAPWVTTQVPTLRRRRRDGGEQSAVGDDRAERMEAWSAVTADCRQVADGEDHSAAEAARRAARATTPGQSRAATTASSGASASNSDQRATA